MIANAGIGGTRKLVELPWEDIQQTILVYSLAPMDLIRAALPNMIRRGQGYIAGISVTHIHPGYIRTPLTDAHKGRMMFLMDVDRAVRLILRAITQKRRVYDFPWQMGLLMRFVRMLPPAIYDRIVSARGEIE